MERDCDLGEMPGTVQQKLVEAPMPCYDTKICARS